MRLSSKTSVSFLKCLLKMATELTCLQLKCSTHFLDDSRCLVDDSGLTVSDLPPRCEKVILCGDGEVKEEFGFGNEGFVFISL